VRAAGREGTARADKIPAAGAATKWRPWSS